MVESIIVIAVIAIIIGAATAYILNAKKSGVKCIGCPAGCNCSHGKDNAECGGCCGGTEAENSGCCCQSTENK